MVWTEEAPGAQVKTLWVTEIQREMALKYLSQVRSTRQKDEPGWGGVLGGAAIHNHKNIKQGRADEPEEKKHVNLLISSFANMFLLLPHQLQAPGWVRC